VITLGPGIQVVSAKNAYGKSLAAKAVVWCFGAEAIFGVTPGDAGFFPDAIREEIDFGDERGIQVLSSECTVALQRSDGASLRITRPVIGKTSFAIIEEKPSPDTPIRKSVFQNTQRSMQDETGGFQRFLFDWIGWPRTKVATFKGTASELYVENLVPSFYIDQKEGWTDIQALQIGRYGQLQISEIAIEYALGALEQVKLRVAQQESSQRRAALKQVSDAIAGRVTTLLAARGWTIAWSSHGSVTDVAARWSLRKLHEELKLRQNVDLGKRIGELNENIGKLRRALTSDPVDPANMSASIGASQRAIELKNERHQLNAELNTLRLQYAQASELISSLEHRIQSASDLVRLKVSGVGRLDQMECPTCHRDLDPETFALSMQTGDEVEAHIAALKRDRALMKNNLDALAASIRTKTGEIGGLDERLRDAERALTTVTDAVGTVREQLANRAAELSAAERELDRVGEWKREIAQFQSEIDNWFAEVRSLGDLDSVQTDIEKRRSELQNSLAKYLAELGHSSVTDSNVATLRLDDEYTPYLGARRMLALGSASDQSRLVAAFSLALADASVQLGGFHPGFVLLDEPLQQNPDNPHRDLLFAALRKELSRNTGFQTVIFTWLPDSDVTQLRSAGITVLEPSGSHFLQPLLPAVDKGTEQKRDTADNPKQGEPPSSSVS
jgi:hypothetical protein